MTPKERGDVYRLRLAERVSDADQAIRQVDDFAVSLAFFLAATGRFMTRHDRWDLLGAELMVRERFGLWGRGIWPAKWIDEAPQEPDDVVQAIPRVMARSICGRPWLGRVVGEPGDNVSLYDSDVAGRAGGWCPRPDAPLPEEAQAALDREARPCLSSRVVNHCASLLNVAVGAAGDEVKPPVARPSVPKQPRTGMGPRARQSSAGRDERLSDGAEARELLDLLGPGFFCLAVAVVFIFLEPTPGYGVPADKCSPRRLGELAEVEDTFRRRAGCRGPGFARILLTEFSADDLPRPLAPIPNDTLSEVAQRFIGRVMGASVERKLAWFRRAMVLYQYPFERLPLFDDLIDARRRVNQNISS